MNYGKTMTQYKKVNVETAGQLGLIIMCYEKAIQFVNQAKSFYEEEQFEQKSNSMQKAMDIINELWGCLNMEKGGQIANNLNAIYAYINRRLLEGDINRDVRAFTEVVNILSELKSAWEGISSAEEEEGSVTQVPNTIRHEFTQVAA